MTRPGVMHLTDTLEAGGAERVALNLVNLLPRQVYVPHLCTTRKDGPLADEVAPDVGRLSLMRKWTFDGWAVARLVAYIRRHRIQILHAHGAALFIAALASRLAPRPAVVWHVHFGQYATEATLRWPLAYLARMADAVITVNEPLSRWARQTLRVPPDRVWTLSNFIHLADTVDDLPALPGEAGKRVVCVANLRPVKDHYSLVRAMASVVREVPGAHLLLVGAASDAAHAVAIRSLVAELGLERHVSFLGERRDVVAILRRCDIGVLSSVAEGTPLALLEYGAVGLPAVATRVGECEQVLDGGRVGLIVSPEDPAQLSKALISLLRSPSKRMRLGAQFQQWVASKYVERSAIERVCAVYEAVLHSRNGQEAPPARSSSSARRPTRSGRGVLIVGNFLSSSIGTRSVCEDLAERLAASGWDVTTSSEHRMRLTRAFNMVATALGSRGRYELAHVDVYSGRAFLWAELVCAVLRRLRKPYVLTLHGGGLPAFAARWPGRVRRLLRSANAVTAPSMYLLEQMSRYRQDLRLIPNAVELGEYGFRPRAAPRAALVWLRAFDAIYNPVLAPKTLALLANNFPEARLTMIGPDKGDGSLQATQRMAKELGVSHLVTFAGPVPRADVAQYLDRGDVFLNTTSADNTPVSVLEALACGLCVVSTDVGGIPYLLEHDRDALLVPPNDPQAMAAAVRRLLTEPGLAERLSQNGRRNVEASDWTAVLPLWEELLSQHAGARPR